MKKNKLNTPNYRICFIAPHLSTGGMPAFLLKRIQTLLKYTKVEIFVIEWCDYSPTFIVQKQQIKKLVGDNFLNLGSIDNTESGIHGSKENLIDFLYENKIDIIHIEEIPEGFDSFNPFTKEIQKKIYNKKHPWRVVETCHNMYFNPDKDKVYSPDGYACVTPHHVKNTFKNQKSNKSLIPFPIDPSIQYKGKKDNLLNEMGYRLKGEFHIVNIGLWTSGKNQGHALNIAKELYDKYGFTYIFHFVGNQAPNFKEYWGPLMDDVPPNVNVVVSEPNPTCSCATLVPFVALSNLALPLRAAIIQLFQICDSTPSGTTPVCFFIGDSTLVSLLCCLANLVLPNL